MRVHVLQNIMIDGVIVAPGREAELSAEQYGHLRKQGAVETVGERDAKARAEAIAKKAREDAEASAAEAEAAALADGKAEAELARAEAEASEPSAEPAAHRRKR